MKTLQPALKERGKAKVPKKQAKSARVGIRRPPTNYVICDKVRGFRKGAECTSSEFSSPHFMVVNRRAVDGRRIPECYRAYALAAMFTYMDSTICE